MRRMNLCVAAALGAALALGTVAGCGSTQQSGSESTKTNEPAAAEASQEDLMHEFKDAAVNAPAFKSVTVTNETVSKFLGEKKADDDTPDTITEKSVYKFDESGVEKRASCEAEVMGSVKITCIVNGEDAVYVTDQATYGGKASELEKDFADGCKAYVQSVVGDPKTLVECASDIKKEQKGDETVYTLTLDPAKYMQSDAILKLLADSSPIKGEVVTVTYDKDGQMTAMSEKTTFADTETSTDLAFTDYDATTVENLPKADKTFADMKKEEDAKIDEVFGEVDDAAAEKKE